MPDEVFCKTSDMDSFLYSFEKLETWQIARMLASDVYRTTSSFPPEEKFGLTLQIRRAALSITANIAEGAGRTSPKDQAKFTTMAYSSLLELLNHLILASDLNFLSSQVLKEYRTKIYPLSVKLSNLKNSQLKRAAPET